MPFLILAKNGSSALPPTMAIFAPSASAPDAISAIAAAAVARLFTSFIISSSVLPVWSTEQSVLLCWMVQVGSGRLRLFASVQSLSLLLEALVHLAVAVRRAVVPVAEPF